MNPFRINIGPEKSIKSYSSQWRRNLANNLMKVISFFHRQWLFVRIYLPVTTLKQERIGMLLGSSW
jgi:hypothetical protein